MMITLVGFLFIFCALATGSPVPAEDFDIIGPFIKGADIICQVKGRYMQMPFADKPEFEDVFFELRTPCKKQQHLVSDANKLRDSPDFDATKNTVIFVSGWNSEMDADYTTKLTEAYHCRGGHNFIVVNTSGNIKGLYVKSAYNTNRIGEAIAMGLKQLDIPGENIHLIGHSLGAHIMGSAGNKFRQLTKTKIGRITGLDPAKPCYETFPVFRKLSAKDANFVDIIHSNSNEAGTAEAIGHADFYPGGIMSQQPACDRLDIICSHAMSIRYYTESVYKGNEQNFVGTQCQSKRSLTSMKCDGTKQTMGFDADKSSKGIYYLGVDKAAPYGRNARRSGRKLDSSCGKCEK